MENIESRIGKNTLKPRKHMSVIEFRKQVRVGKKTIKPLGEKDINKESPIKKERIDLKLKNELEENNRTWEIRKKEEARKHAEDIKIKKKSPEIKETWKNTNRESGIEDISYTDEPMTLIQGCAPPKLSDPGRMTIPCRIGNLKFKGALIDTGAGINMLPLYVTKMLGFGEREPTQTCVCLADQSIIKATGSLKNVFIQLDKYLFTTDFITLDTLINPEVPLIFGRLFLATIGAIIDIRKGTLTINLKEKTLIFEVLANMPRSRRVIKKPKAIVDSTKDENSLEGGSYISDEILDPNFLRPFNFILNLPPPGGNVFTRYLEENRARYIYRTHWLGERLD